MAVMFRGGPRARPGALRKPAIVLSGLLALTGAAVPAAEVYRSTGPDGVPVFSDQPSADAQRIEIQSPAVVYEAPPPPTPAAAETPATQVEFEELAITAPAPDSMHWKAAGPIGVAVRARPALVRGQVSVLLVDGVEAARKQRATRLRLPVETLNPGEHHLQVEVRDGADVVLGRTEAVRIYVQQARFKPPPPDPTKPPKPPKPPNPPGGPPGGGTP